MTVFFGDRWDAPIVDDAEQVPTPAGQECYACGEQVAAGDRGLIRACARMVDGRPVAQALPVHTECDMLGVLGHQWGVCPCTGYGHDRAAGLELLARVNMFRAGRGQPPL